MIPSSAAWVGASWERLRVPLLEQRRVAGREPLLERRLEGQPGYLGGSLLHLHRHRAAISATQPTDIPLTDIRAIHSRAMDTQATRVPRLTLVLLAMDIQATRDSPLTPVLRAMDTQAPQGILLIPAPQATDTQATRHTPLILVLQTTDTQARREIPLMPLLQDINMRPGRSDLLSLLFHAKGHWRSVSTLDGD